MPITLQRRTNPSCPGEKATLNQQATIGNGPLLQRICYSRNIFVPKYAG